MKVVINTCYGGFGLSQEAIRAYLSLKGRNCFFYKHELKDGKFIFTRDTEGNLLYSCSVLKDLGDNPSEEEVNSNLFHVNDIERYDGALIEVVAELGEKANDSCSELTIIEIPDDIEWKITEHAGNETVEEKHRSWS